MTSVVSTPAQRARLLATLGLALLSACAAPSNFDRAPGAKRYRSLPPGSTVKVVDKRAELPQPTEVLGVLRASTAGTTPDRTEAEVVLKRSAPRYGCDAISDLKSKRREIETKRRIRLLGTDGKERIVEEIQKTVEHDWVALCVRTAEVPDEDVGVVVQAAVEEGAAKSDGAKADKAAKKPKSGKAGKGEDDDTDVDDAAKATRARAAKAKAEAEAKAKEEARLKAEAKALEEAKAEARAKALEEAKAEARAKALEEAKAEARAKALEEAKAEARAKALEEAKAEARAKATEEARVKAAQDGKTKGAEEARAKAADEARAKAAEEAKAKAEARAKAEAKAKADEARSKGRAEATAEAPQPEAADDSKSKSEDAKSLLAEIEAENKGKGKGKGGPESKPATTKPEPKQDPKAAARAEAETTKAEPKAPVKADAAAKGGPKPEAPPPPPAAPPAPVPQLEANPRLPIEVAKFFRQWSKQMMAGMVDPLCASFEENVSLDIGTGAAGLRIRKVMPAQEACALLKGGDLATYMKDFGPSEVHAEVEYLLPTLFATHGSPYLKVDDATQRRYAEEINKTRAAEGKKVLQCTSYAVTPVGEDSYAIQLGCQGVTSFKLIINRVAENQFKVLRFTHQRP